jgi:hypothetical protein
VPMPATPVGRVYVHHSVTPMLADPAQTVRDIQRGHLTHPKYDYSDIAYHELVDHRGDAWEGRGFDYRDGATWGQSGQSLSVCLLMNAEAMLPTAAMLDGLVNRIVAAARAGRLAAGFEILGHRDAPGNATACPGRHVHAALPEVRRRVAAALTPSAPPRPTPAPIPVPPPASEDDMPIIVRFTDKGDYWRLDGGTRRPVTSAPLVAVLAKAGVRVVDVPGKERGALFAAWPDHLDG